MTNPYPESQSPIRVQISDQMMIDGVAIRIAMKFGPDDLRVMKIMPEGYTEFETVDPMVNSGATLQLNHDFARALLDALLRYYQGASDMHTLRADYLHERGRVDKMIQTISGIAEGR